MAVHCREQVTSHAGAWPAVAREFTPPPGRVLEEWGGEGSTFRPSPLGNGRTVYFQLGRWASPPASAVVDKLRILPRAHTLLHISILVHSISVQPSNMATNGIEKVRAALEGWIPAAIGSVHGPGDMV